MGRLFTSTTFISPPFPPVVPLTSRLEPEKLSGFQFAPPD
jgi:hypothetical protein